MESACSHLGGIHDSARADAEILLGFVRGAPRHEPYGFPEREMDATQLREFKRLLARRHQGEPIAYLIGEREFWSLKLRVTPDTLVPRPETELLVRTALECTPPGVKSVADLGTGSGAIALAIAKERPCAGVVATDVSAAALEVARANAQRLGIENVEFRLGDWCEPLGRERFDVIVSNPPYVAAGDPHLERGDLRFEPELALCGGDRGLVQFPVIGEQCRERLHAGGALILEHGADQAEAVQQILAACGYTGIRSFRDLAGHPRVCLARRAVADRGRAQGDG